MRDLGSLLRDSAARFGSEPALAGGGVALDYRALLEKAERGAGHLRTLGLRPGDRVLLHLPSRPEWAAAFFAILDAGCVAVPVPFDIAPAALAAIQAHAGSAACIGPHGIAPDELFLGPRRHPAAHPLAMLAFTSGSTGRPRAVEITHRNLLADLDALLQVRRCRPGDAFLSVLPPAHLFELMGGLLGPLACGARVVYPGALLPNRLVETLREARITHAMAVPALVGALVRELAGTDVRGRIGDRFGTLVVGGAALDPALADACEAFGVRVDVGYGLTEAAPIVSVGASCEIPRGSVGRPLPGIEVRADGTGELLVKGANVMRGYFRDPEATAGAFDKGWLRTGDRGRIDGNGFLFVTGRVKEAIVTATGETVYPDEVEPYYGSELFAEWCVAALPGPNGNDRMALFVVPAAPDVPEPELQEQFAGLRAAAPSRCRAECMVRVSGPLPRTATGKVRRAVLAQEFVP